MRGPKGKTLYLRRYLLNGQDILDWAAANGAGGDPVRAGAMRVTIAYSLRPLDWRLVALDLEPMAILSRRGRRVERMEGNAAALLFEAPELTDRHNAILQLGASGGFRYRPYVMFAHGPDFRPPDGKAFDGPLYLGPEMMSSVPARGSHV